MRPAGTRRPATAAALPVWRGSEESAFVIGQTHVIDGGWSLA